MKKIKIVSLISLVFFSGFFFFYLQTTFEDLFFNEFIFVDMYLGFTEEGVSDISINRLIDLVYSEFSSLLYFIFILVNSFHLILFIMIFMLLFNFVQEKIYIKRNFTILKIMIAVYFAKTIFIPIIEYWFIDIINELIGKNLELRDSFFDEAVEGILLICIITVVSWIFLESIDMKKKSDEYEMQKNYLVQQHKLSQLGQLLGFISHQWKEPLSRISSHLVSMQISNHENEKLVSKIDICQQEIEYMYSTMSRFRSFYKGESKEEYFYFDKAISYIFELLKDDLLMNKIDIEYKNDNSEKIKGNENDFSQIVLILINNSKEAFKEKDIKKREIKIEIKENTFYYSDNAKGVDEESLQDIFKVNITTKEANMGIGLYMAKLILEEKFDTDIKARNTKDGLLFEIKLEKERKDA